MDEGEEGSADGAAAFLALIFSSTAVNSFST